MRISVHQNQMVLAPVERELGPPGGSGHASVQDMSWRSDVNHPGAFLG